jgi:hypothetical protein
MLTARESTFADQDQMAPLCCCMTIVHTGFYPVSRYFEILPKNNEWFCLNWKMDKSILAFERGKGLLLNFFFYLIWSVSFETNPIEWCRKYNEICRRYMLNILFSINLTWCWSSADFYVIPNMVKKIFLSGHHCISQRSNLADLPRLRQNTLAKLTKIE